jgi:sugar lactone lactonase YvrE
MDEMGNLFIADSSNNRIRKVSQDGTIRTLAGNGKPGFSGDGGPGVSAQLNAPTALTVDGRGNLFIVDTGNNRIRKLSSDGSISTVAGTGRVGFSGDGRPAASAAFNRPTGVAIDGEGNVYVADTLNHRVRKISAEGLVTTIAGNGKAASNGDGGPAVSASINEPKGLAVDRVGNVFVTDFGDGRHGSDNGVRPGEYKNGRVRKILKSGSISTVSGPQAPFQAEIPWNPQGVAVDREGSLYVVDTYRRIAKIAADGTTTALKMYSSPGYSVPPGDSGDFGPAVFAQLNKPASVAADDAGNIFIADQGNYRIRKVGPSGVITPFAGTAGVRGYGGDDGPANAARFGDAIRIAVDREGNVFVADPTNQRVRKILVSGVIQTVAGNGTAGYSGDGGPAVSAQLNNPLDVSVDREGNIFIADRGNARVRKVSPSGVISTVAGNGRRGFSGDGGRATAARLGILGTIAVDDRGTIFIATVDVGGYRNVYRVRKISQGIISTVDRTRFPAHAVIAVHPDGTLFGTDGARILMMRPSGAGVIVAGGMSSFNGDNAPIYSLGVSPHDLWIDRSGDIYIADGHHRIRKVVLPLQRNP